MDLEAKSIFYLSFFFGDMANLKILCSRNPESTRQVSEPLYLELAILEDHINLQAGHSSDTCTIRDIFLYGSKGLSIAGLLL